MLFTAQDIAQNFDARDHNRGRIYQTQGQVIHLETSDQGKRLRALVQGTALHPYQVDIYVGRRGGMTEIESECTCPVGYMCKHGVAALYEAIAQESRAHEKIGPVAQGKGKKASVLSPKLAQWVEQFDAEPNDIALPQDDRIVYQIVLDDSIEAGVKVIPGLQHRLRDGNWSRKRPISSGQIYALKHSPRLMNGDDRFLLDLIASSNTMNTTSLIWELPRDAQTINHYLKRIIQTGRAFLDEDCLFALTSGAPMKGSLSWDFLPDGRQRASIVPEKEGVVPLVMEAPWYVDPKSGEAGPLLCEATPAFISSFLSAPCISEEEAAILRKRLANAKQSVPAPYEVVRGNDKMIAPLPRIVLTEKSVAGHETTEHVISVSLSFIYNGHGVSPNDQTPHYAEKRDDKIILQKRNIKAEGQILQEIDEQGLTFAQETHALTLFSNSCPLTPREDASPWFWYDFIHRVCPLLQANGFDIQSDIDLSGLVVTPDTADIDASFKQDGAWWFSMDLGITVGGERVPLLPLLVNMIKKIRSPADLERIKQMDTCFAPLPDGRQVALPGDRVYTILKTLVELFDDKSLDDDGKLRISMDLTAAFLKLEAITRKRWIGESGLRRIVEKLCDFEGIKKHAAPKNLKATLRHYQIDGYNWLHFLGEYGLSGVLADDMGLGKTIQTLAYIQARKEKKTLEGPCLIVMPTSLIANWQAEASRFTPQLKILTLHGKDRAKLFKKAKDHDLVLTTYPLLPRDKDVLCKQQWSLVILDEAQAIKNPSAKVTQAVCELNATQRLCLTGTPVENHLGEAWSIFTFLLPGLLGNHKEFARHYRNPIEKDSDSDRKDLLARRLRPFVLRRLKSEVAKELPPKTEIIRRVTLTDDQRDLYETVRHVMNDKIRDEISAKGLSRSHIVILDALLKLRQICCDPRLVKLEAARKVLESAKLDELMEMIPTLIEEGRRILLFSQFTSMLDLIRGPLTEAGIPFVELRGTTKDRVTPIKRFQDGEVPLFLISLKAGGTGLNLTAADTVIHYDPWWNPSVENQATDRAHRIGQDKPVFVYKLIAEGTVEEKILELQSRKADLANALFGDAPAAAASLTQEDISWLLGDK